MDPDEPTRSGRGLSSGRAHVEVSSTPRLDAQVRVWLQNRAEAALEVLGAIGEVRVRIVDDAVMAASHEGFAGVPGTTDVLTFDLSDPHTPGLDVDILVCLDEAARQGSVRGHPPERELLLYILHGVLHCLGHDDHDPVAAARMHTEEDRVLEAIGVGATFATEIGETAG